MASKHRILEFTPDNAEVYNDPVEYRIRFYKPDTELNAAGIDLLLPANEFLTLLTRSTPPLLF